MILVAPTAFKGTIAAPVAAQAMAAGARDRDVVVVLPLSDGGHGLLDALAAARGGHVEPVPVTGPLGEVVEARVLVLEEMSVVESADANGLHLVPPDRRDPMVTTTYGVGELVRTASVEAADRVVVGIGGSATVDGGAGMAQALGWRLLDQEGRAIPRGGRGLLRLHRVEPADAPVSLPPVTVLRDVHNPLLGPQGAASVYGPQKGASPEDVERLEEGLARLADCWQRDLGRDVRDRPGAGAAGGLGAGLAAFLEAELVDGAAWVLDAVGFDQALARADLVVTGEGAFDAQSGMGKITGAVLDRARAAGVPALLVAGTVEGPAPDGIRVVTGSGTLDPPDLTRLVAQELALR